MENSEVEGTETCKAESPEVWCSEDEMESRQSRGLVFGKIASGNLQV